MTAEEKRLEKLHKMTEKPVPRLICGLAVPTIITMLITSLYNMADTYFVSSLGNDQTGAVGVVFPIMAIIQALGFFFGQGSGNYISRALGKNDPDSAEEMASIGFFSCFVFMTLISVICAFFIEPICRFIGSTESILPHAKDYMKWILLGAPFMASSYVLNTQLRFQGNAFYSMIGIGIGAVVNVGLDPLFISSMDLGVEGAAIATILSQFLSFILLLFGTQKSDSLRIKFKSFRFSKFYFGEIVKCGTPSLARQGLASVATTLLNRAAGNYGAEAAIAAMTVVSKLVSFAASALIGFGQGFQPVCGFNWGAGLFIRVKQAVSFCIKAAFVGLLAIAFLGFAFAPQLIRLFRDDAEVIRIGSYALRMQCIALPFQAVTVMTNMALQNIGKVIRATVLSMARQGLTFIPAIIILPLFFQLDGVIFAQGVADILAFLIALPFIIVLYKDLNQKILQPQAVNHI